MSDGHRATVRTDHDDPVLVARALRPDNTAEMETTVEDGTLRTQITRETVGGLQSTVDDYVVNLDVAERIVQHATDANQTCRRRHDADRHQTDTDTNL
ncbi:KEOPS complex subunit Pcc1 [Natronobiforma cellulositropha]|uniref:KEOPS complex subunit Pcc1 n=1 Tax=Natronobiforma cellulositropha TaxID=1679076 RepID=UPI0021D58D04|nr:KEOPS complex subunit Pcc1 [Natronobiforma cellulositropha]